MDRNFTDAIAAALGNAPAAGRLQPGKIVRFSANGKRGDDSGWALLFQDERGGVFGDWRTGFEGSWHATLDRPLTGLERKARALQIESAQKQREADERARHEAASLNAVSIWNSAALCVRHEYAQQKGIGLRGLRMQRGHLGHCSGAFYVTGPEGHAERLKGDLLLVPMYGLNKRLWSLQAIDSAGRKSFLKGGRTRGLFFPVGAHLLRGVDQSSYMGEIAIAEGLATAVTVHEMAKIPVFAAFTAGNLIHVAKAIRPRLPQARVLIAGDVDASGVGQAKAEEAALAARGLVCFPPFTEGDITAGASDWNDFSRLHPEGHSFARQA